MCAIMSDLHCRLASSSTDSSLEVGATRIPPMNHPVQALLDLLAERHVRADALIIPGDMANKASREGLNQAWDFAIEVGGALGTKKTIPVLGNHDVDSRRSRPDQDAFYDVRNLRPGFPFRNEKSNSMYFGEGFCIQPIDDAAEVVAINTVVDHHDEKSAERGAFDDSRIHRLSKFLESAPPRPIRIGLMHHHPILHTGPFTLDSDVLQNGDKLLKALRENGCRLVVHGHKHLARLSMNDGVAVFACGSFSANLGIHASSMANMFHFLEVEELGGHVRGRIETWVFHYGTGWGRASSVHSGFPFSTGFGARVSVDAIASALVELADQGSGDHFSSGQVIAAAPDFVHLTPSELKELDKQLRARKLELIDGRDGVAEMWRQSG